MLKTKISSLLGVSLPTPPKFEFVEICMREPVCAVNIIVSIYGWLKLSPNFFPAPDSMGEMPAKEANCILIKIYFLLWINWYVVV
jgi:hypothetical protein